MKPASGNLKDCYDLDTLREWIADLQEVASICMTGQRWNS